MSSTKQQALRTQFFSKFLLGTSLLAAGYLLWADYELALKAQEAHALRTTAELELRYLETRAATVSNDLNELSTAQGKERYLRSQYLVGKEGEEVIIVSGLQGEVPTEEKVVQKVETRWWKW